MSRISAAKSYLARIPLSLATHGSDREMLGLTYATRNLSAPMAQLLAKTQTTAVIAHSLTKNSFITFVSNFACENNSLFFLVTEPSSKSGTLSQADRDTCRTWPRHSRTCAFVAGIFPWSRD